MNYKNLGQRIKAAREDRGLTQEQLAENVGLSPMHISVIERGVKPPKLDTFVRIANALGVSADLLLQDSVENTAKVVISDISRMVEGQPKQTQQLIAHCIRAYIEGSEQYGK